MREKNRFPVGTLKISYEALIELQEVEKVANFRGPGFCTILILWGLGSILVIWE
jgi:hypothetical protein